MSQGMMPPGSRGAPPAAQGAQRPKAAPQPMPQATPAAAPRTPPAAAPGGWQRVMPQTVTAPGRVERETTAHSGSQAGAPRLAFFGQPAWARRVAFILDTSGSMAGPRWQACSRELATALQALPEDAEFLVVLFSDRLSQPPGQAGWMRCRRDVVAGVVDWVRAFAPSGGTLPRPAFELVFALPQRPEAVYFLTDGEFADPTPAQVAAMNGAGALARITDGIRRLFGGAPVATVPIHTLTLDETAGAAVLQRISADSGGTYAHVSSGAAG